VQTNKGDVYSFYFSERGVPKEIHSKEEILPVHRLVKHIMA
jgi:hypothetical protein